MSISSIFRGVNSGTTASGIANSVANSAATTATNAAMGSSTLATESSGIAGAESTIQNSVSEQEGMNNAITAAMNALNFNMAENQVIKKAGDNAKSLTQ
ncbi:hypothetical protein WS90_25150 [Burkholderia cepacia]|uniref:Uncharacterized protein n=1 Tax=Burkholderia cepacia TaxID=292 RepID=A0A103ZA04_BURCE|nr:hypothetical protein [Burkholderia cepacia]KVK75936.1 hypothetical protein WS90_25150 [Burkholderia cepacia]